VIDRDRLNRLGAIALRRSRDGLAVADAVKPKGVDRPWSPSVAGDGEADTPLAVRPAAPRSVDATPPEADQQTKTDACCHQPLDVSSGRVLSAQFEGAEMKFISGLGRGDLDERERRVRVLLPDREIFRRDGEPAEPEHIAARFGHASGLLPCDFIGDHRFPRSWP
jgi:hypothetical protein